MDVMVIIKPFENTIKSAFIFQSVKDLPLGDTMLNFSIWNGLIVGIFLIAQLVITIVEHSGDKTPWQEANLLMHAEVDLSTTNYISIPTSTNNVYGYPQNSTMRYLSKHTSTIYDILSVGHISFYVVYGLGSILTILYALKYKETVEPVNADPSKKVIKDTKDYIKDYANKFLLFWFNVVGPCQANFMFNLYTLAICRKTSYHLTFVYPLVMTYITYNFYTMCEFEKSRFCKNTVGRLLNAVVYVIGPIQIFMNSDILNFHGSPWTITLWGIQFLIQILHILVYAKIGTAAIYGNNIESLWHQNKEPCSFLWLYNRYALRVSSLVSILSLYVIDKYD
jgi:hypothetical protein